MRKTSVNFIGTLSCFVLAAFLVLLPSNAMGQIWAGVAGSDVSFENGGTNYWNLEWLAVYSFGKQSEFVG